MKRVNVKLLLVLVLVVATAAAGIFLLNRYQVSRNAGGLVTLARQRITEGKTAEASGLFARYLGLRPNDSAVVAEYATLLLDRADTAEATRGDLERAFAVLEQAVRANPENDALRRRLAEFELKIGRFNDAREHLSMLRQRLAADAASPEDSDLRLLEARAALGQGAFEEAADLTAGIVGYDLGSHEFREGRRAADLPEAYALLARILRDRLAAPDGAKQVLDRLVQLHGDSASAWVELARWHRQSNDTTAAAANIRTAFRIDPKNIDVIFNAFELALQTNDAEWADQMAKQALELFPNDERAYRAAATVALQRGDREAATAALTAGVNRLPSKGSLLIMLADNQLQQSQFDDAQQTITRISEVFGSSSPAVGLLEGRLLMGRQNWIAAQRRLEGIRPMAVGLPELAKQIDLCLAHCAEKLGDHDEQLAVNRRILVEDPTSIAASVGAAAALYAAGRSDDALVAYEALGKALGGGRLGTVPQVWYPLLQLRIASTIQQPVATRDWSSVDELLETLLESEAISDSQLSVLRADVLAQKGETEAALGILEKLVAGGAADAQVWQALATLKLRSGGAVAARETMARLPQEYAATPGLILMEARIALLENDGADEVLEGIERRATSLEPEAADAVLRGLATLQLDAGRLEEAERLWQDIARRTPGDIQARSALLQIALSGLDPEKMRTAAAEVAKVAGDDSARARLAEAWVRIIDVKLEQREAATTPGEPVLTEGQRAALAEARGMLTEAENARPGWAQVQLALAEIEGMLGNVNPAIERLQRAVELAPTDRRAVGQLCALLYASNRIDEAKRVMAQLGPDPGKGFERLRAEIELRAGRLDQAATLAKNSVAADATNAAEWLWLGQLLDQCGRRDGAGEAFQRATETGKERSDVWLALMSHQMSMGMPRAAEQSLDRGAAAVPPERRDMLLAQGYELLGQLDEAEGAYRRAAATAAPGDTKVIAGHAAFLVRRGRLEAARAELRRILDSTPQDGASGDTIAWARRTLAELLGSQGTYKNLEEAIDLIRQNHAADGSLSPDDVALQLRLLVSRPEPASWRRGIDMLDALATVRPLTTGQRLVRAQLLEKCGRWDEARNEMVAIVATPAAPAPFIAMLVEKLLDHNEVATARTWLARLKTAAPKAETTQALEARLAAAENDWNTATTLVRTLVPNIDVNPERAKTLPPLAALLENFGFTDDAEMTLRRYAERAPEGALALADFLGRRQRGDEALDILDAARVSLSAERLLASALNAVRVSGGEAAACRRVEAWIAEADRADPDSVAIEILAAELLGVEGRADEAEAAYRRLRARSDLDPTQSAIVANNLAFHLARPETATEAGELITSAMATLGPHPDLLDTRALVKLALGENEAAVADLEEAVLAPSAVKLLHLAYANLKVGNLARARDSLDKSREKGLGTEILSRQDRVMLDELEQRLKTATEQALDSGRENRPS